MIEEMARIIAAEFDPVEPESAGQTITRWQNAESAARKIALEMDRVG